MTKTIGIGLAIASALLGQDPAQTIRVEKQIISGSASAGLQTFEFVGGQILPGKTVKGMPYSAEAVTQTTQTLADGSHIVNSSTSMVYRDSEGRERREESIGKLGAWSAQGQPTKAIFISDPVANVSYSLDANTHTARKMPLMVKAMSRLDPTILSMHASMIAPPPPPPGSATVTSSSVSGGGPNMVFYSTAGSMSSGTEPAPKVENLGTTTIEGVTAEGTRTTVTIPAGQIGNEHDLNIVSERWYSPELQVVVKSTHSDPRMGETTYKLTNLNRTEPLPSMFQVPPDYSVAESPSPKMLMVQPKKDNDR